MQNQHPRFLIREERLLIAILILTERGVWILLALPFLSHEWPLLLPLAIVISPHLPITHRGGSKSIESHSREDLSWTFVRICFTEPPCATYRLSVCYVFMSVIVWYRALRLTWPHELVIVRRLWTKKLTFYCVWPSKSDIYMYAGHSDMQRMKGQGTSGWF